MLWFLLITAWWWVTNIVCLIQASTWCSVTTTAWSLDTITVLSGRNKWNQLTIFLKFLFHLTSYLLRVSCEPMPCLPDWLFDHPPSTADLALQIPVHRLKKKIKWKLNKIINDNKFDFIRQTYDHRYVMSSAGEHQGRISQGTTFIRGLSSF